MVWVLIVNYFVLRHYYGPHVVGSDGLDIDGVQNVIVAASWVRSGVMLKVYLAFIAISLRIVPDVEVCRFLHNRQVNDGKTQNPPELQ